MRTEVIQSFGPVSQPDAFDLTRQRLGRCLSIMLRQLRLSILYLIYCYCQQFITSTRTVVHLPRGFRGRIFSLSLSLSFLSIYRGWGSGDNLEEGYSATLFYSILTVYISAIAKKNQKIPTGRKVHYGWMKYIVQNKTT